MATVIFCSVCGHPIIEGECVHTAKNLTAKEWRERVKRKQREKDERQTTHRPI